MKSPGSEVKREWLGHTISVRVSCPAGAFGKGGNQSIAFRIAQGGTHSPGATDTLQGPDPDMVPAEPLQVRDIILWKEEGTDANP